MCAVAVTKKIEIAEREKKIIGRIIGGALYRFLFIFWGAATDWDGQLHHYRDFRAGGYPPPHLLRVEAGTMAGEGASGGGGVVRIRGETGYDGGPAAAAAAATVAAGRGSLPACLPVISVSSALANLTNYTLPQPARSLLLPLTGRRRGRGVVLYQR